jgi:peptide/nickel transport system substrate-binding protein
VDQIRKVSARKGFISSIKESMRRAMGHFSILERFIFIGLSMILAGSVISILMNISSIFTKEIPKYGGKFTEGIIGTPRFINPILMISDSDRDLSSLVYSGLTRIMPDGSVVPDLAEKYKISDDGKTYTFTIKNNARFQDGTNVTAEDVIFTINKIQDPANKSPKRASFDGVSVEKISEKEVAFHLKSSYAPFIVNTSIGILPKNYWKDTNSDNFPLSQHNFKDPVGTGPYRIKEISYSTSGLPEKYILEPFDNFTLGKPHVSEIDIILYPNERAVFEAYKNGEIDSLSGISPESVPLLGKNAEIIASPMPRIIAVFLNQNEAPIFTHEEVRKALSISTNRTDMIEKILLGFGNEKDGPLPFDYSAPTSGSIEEGRKMLTDNGWQYNDSDKVFEKILKKDKKSKKEEKIVLKFTLYTSNVSDLEKTAKLLKENWEKLGAQVDLKVYEPGDLNQNIIRPRKFDALLFGEIIGHDMDLYSFWHSSQRNDPGLNVAMYTNVKADKLLENGRVTSNKDEQDEIYNKFSSIVKDEVPVIFLYSPDFIYVKPKNVSGIVLPTITTPTERFSKIYSWYVYTENVWRIFAN